ncbi:MAG: hypothetical protein ACRC3Y_04920, partial [Romboutsia sp.]|uniref:hypothetical protein n=1 Tax=Romboutsia sp. TaxID=1965302 RepID=UPI003F2C887A
ISEPVGFSINTYNLANILNKRKINHLILDMCSMNFIEVIYEILYKGNVENLLTYRSFAPIEGIKIKEIIESIEGNDFKEKFFYLDSLLISLNKENIKELDLFRVKQNKKILGLLDKKDREFKRGIHILRTEGIKIGLQTKRGDALSGDTLGYIKYFLENEAERKIYSRYRYTKNNLWNIIVRAEFKVYDEEINIIKLENTGLLNIIMTYVKEEEAVKLVEEYLREKEEYIKP